MRYCKGFPKPATDGVRPQRSEGIHSGEKIPDPDVGSGIFLQILHWSAGSSPPDRSWRSPALSCRSWPWRLLPDPPSVSLTAGISGLRYLNTGRSSRPGSFLVLINPHS